MNISFCGSNQNNNNNQTKYSYAKREITSIITGSLAQTGVSLATVYANNGILKQFLDYNNKLTDDEANIVKDGFSKAFDSTGLNGKVKVQHITATTIINPDDKILQEIKAGRNAFFEFTQNQILLPENKLSLTWLHELGHALNRNTSNFLKNLQDLRIPTNKYAIPIVATLGLFQEQKQQEGNKPLNATQKAFNLIRNNIGLLVFALHLPTLIEEGIASHKAEKLAQKVLPKNLLSKVKNSNRLGFATYLLLATGTSLAATVGRKIADKVREKINTNQTTPSTCQ